MEYFLGKVLHMLGIVFIFVASATLTFFFFFQITPSFLWFFPIVALVMFEGGVLHWGGYHRHGAENAYQAITSLIMVLISLLAVAISSMFEIIRFMQPEFHVDLSWMNYALWAVPAVFPLNVMAATIESLVSNKHMAKWKTAFNSRPQVKEEKVLDTPRTEEHPIKELDTQAERETDKLASSGNPIKQLPKSRVPRAANRQTASTVIE